MKTILLFALFTLGAFAQSPYLSTTFAAAAGKDHAQITVASTAGITVGMELFSGQEAMLVYGIIGSSLNVQSGIDGTRAGSHLAGDVIYAAMPAAFKPRNPEGKCDFAASALPEWIFPAGAGLWSCVNGSWQPLQAVFSDVNGNVGIGVQAPAYRLDIRTAAGDDYIGMRSPGSVAGGLFGIGATGDGYFPWMVDVKSIFMGIGGVTAVQIGTDRSVTIPLIKSTTGTRYVCVDTAGKLTSSASPCSGT